MTSICIGNKLIDFIETILLQTITAHGKDKMFFRYLSYMEGLVSKEFEIGGLAATTSFSPIKIH